MFYNKQNFKRTAFTALIFTILAFSIFLQIPGIQNIILQQNETEKNSIDSRNPQSSETDYYSKDWIKYGNFSTGASSWWTSDKEGDVSDVDASISGDAANYIVKGAQYEKKFDAPIDTSTASNWIAFNKTEPAMNPDKYITDDTTPNLRGAYFIDDNGFFMNHTWHDDTPDQFVSISWKYNASMGIDMSDYVITSANFDAIMNATVSPV